MKRKSTAEGTPVQNRYYANVSEIFGTLQTVLLLTLLCFTVLGILTNTDNITFQNFAYFVRDLKASAETADVLHSDSVSYPAEDEQSFALYRNGLAVAGNHHVTLFTAGGRKTVGEDVDYQNPKAIGNGKYLLVYEQGGKQYSLFNSYTEVFSGEAPAPIRGAAISESGVYGLTFWEDHQSPTAEIYSPHFKLLSRYTYKDRLMTGLTVSPDGSRVSILSYGIEKGEMLSKVQIYQPGEDALITEQKLGENLFFTCRFFSNGGFAVMSQKELLFLADNGTLQNRVSFNGDLISDSDFTEDRFGLLLQQENGKNLLVFDQTGKQIFADSVAEGVEQLVLQNDRVFLCGKEGLTAICISDEKKSEINCDTAGGVLLGVDDSCAMLCYRQKAVCYRFDFKKNTD